MMDLSLLVQASTAVVAPIFLGSFVIFSVQSSPIRWM